MRGAEKSVNDLNASAYDMISIYAEVFYARKYFKKRPGGQRILR